LVRKALDDGRRVDAVPSIEACGGWR
jgi:hypothetical protein